MDWDFSYCVPGAVGHWAELATGYRASKQMYERLRDIDKTFRFENHSYVYLLVHYEVRRSAIFRTKRGNQTCKPDGHQT